jgi:hypothetical protein
MRHLPLFSCAAMFLTACGATLTRVGESAPIHPAVASRSPEYVFGHRVVVHAGQFAYTGELLGCDEHAVFILLYVLRDDAYRRVPWEIAARVRVSLGGWGGGAIAWGALGSLAALSNGIFWLGTGPLFSIVGTIVGITAMDPGLDAFPPSPDEGPFGPHDSRDACSRIGAYARFPQGLPEAWLRRSLPSPPPLSPLPVDRTQELPAVTITSSASPSPYPSPSSYPPPSSSEPPAPP